MTDNESKRRIWRSKHFDSVLVSNLRVGPVGQKMLEKHEKIDDPRNICLEKKARKGLENNKLVLED